MENLATGDDILDFSNNCLTDINPFTRFLGLDRCKVLNLRNNRITHKSYCDIVRILRKLPSDGFIDLVGNREFIGYDLYTLARVNIRLFSQIIWIKKNALGG